MTTNKSSLTSKSNPYSETTLLNYLEYKEWTHEEALLIFCDCDPQLTNVSWVEYGNEHGTASGENVLENAQLFREWDGMRHIPLEIQTPVLEHPALKDLDITVATSEDWAKRGAIVADQDEPTPVDEIAWKWIHCIQIGFKLSKLHETMMRKSPELDVSPLQEKNKPIKKSVSWWIEWALRHELNIPWLSWIEENNLLPKSSEKIDKVVRLRDLCDQLVDLIDQNENFSSEDIDKIESIKKDLELI